MRTSDERGSEMVRHLRERDAAEVMMSRGRLVTINEILFVVIEIRGIRQREMPQSDGLASCVRQANGKPSE